MSVTLTYPGTDFALTVRSEGDDPPLRNELPGGRWSYNNVPDAATLRLREKVRKAAAYLGPWCVNCGKRGQRCTGRALKGCKARALKRATRGFDRIGFHSLPNPPKAWIVARGYGILTAKYYSGGRWKSGPAGTEKLRLRSGVDWRDMRQHYAYELAMGRADVSETIAA